ncbi:MAG: T9SS type A sorting domain-containing protein [Bacteroidota bacterium]
MKKVFSYLAAIIFLTISVSAFAQQERIVNWSFESGINGVGQFNLNSAWNEYDFERVETVLDTDASNGRCLRCIRNKSFFGKDALGIGQYGGRAQSVIPCPEPGTEYIFSARAKVSGDLGDEGPGEIALYFYDGNEEILSNPIFYFSGTSYEEQTQTITVPNDAVWCRVWVRKDASVDFKTDWVSLKAVTDDTPGAVTNFRASDIGTSKVLLEWDPVAGASGYQILRMPKDSATWRTIFITNKRGTKTSFIDSRDAWNNYLVPGTEYIYKIFAVGDFGSSDTTEINVTTFGALVTSPGNTTYYIDATNGDDAASGTSEATAWKSFMNLDRLELEAGDFVLLKKGEYWNESLILHGNGESGNEITVASYGTAEERPIINVEGMAHAAVRLIDVSYYRVQDLELSNYQPFFREFFKYGIEAGTWKEKSVSGLYFDNLFINKVLGTAVRGGNGGFISDGELTAGIRLATDIRYADFNARMIYDASITNCEIREGGGHSIHMGIIDGINVTNNVVHRGGYTNMLTRRLFNGIIANNYFMEAGYYMTCMDNAGVGMYGGDNMLFEKNVIYKTYNENSGQSLNMDGCDHYIVQYNFFKDSGSGCFVINHAADGNIFRYNISEGFNDQWFRNLGGINTKIYNNTAYVYATNIGIKFVSNSRTVSKNPTPTYNTQVYNNIFIRETSDSVETADLIVERDETVNSEFRNNVYYGNFQDTVPEDKNPFFDDPLLVNPGSGSVDMVDLSISVDGYQLQTASPYCSWGIIIPDNGGFDFWEKFLPPDFCTIGAHQTDDKTTGIENPNSIPETVYFMKNYPNPFNSITNIQYSVPESYISNEQEVNLSIYDMHGSLLKTLVNESQKPGVYTVQWNSKDNMGMAITQGIYLYSIRIGDFSDTKRMILLD